jgi:hypothetical protein
VEFDSKLGKYQLPLLIYLTRLAMKEQFLSSLSVKKRFQYFLAQPIRQLVA